MSIAGPAILALGSAALLYSVAETESFALRRVTIPCLPAGRGQLRVLHISDLHLTPGGRREQEWVSRLVDTEPDFVAATGDFLAHPDAVPWVLAALGPLLTRPGAFVFGSHDYFRPARKNPFRYLIGPSRLERRTDPDMPWSELAGSLTKSGWRDLSNARAELTVRGLRMDLRGVDDPHIGRDAYSLIAGPFNADADLRIGLTHAPYLRVVEAMARDGADLILAGHTHGGQLRIPGWGALVSNCDLSPRLARGLSRHGGSQLHVSAGLGTSPHAPIRFACRPEASLLTLTSAPSGR